MLSFDTRRPVLALDHHEGAGHSSPEAATHIVFQYHVDLHVSEPYILADDAHTWALLKDFLRKLLEEAALLNGICRAIDAQPQRIQLGLSAFPGKGAVTSAKALDCQVCQRLSAEELLTQRGAE